MAVMPRYKYRTIKKPAAASKNITVEEAMESAKIAAAKLAARRLRSAKPNGKVTTKAIAGSKSTHSPKSSSGAVGKSTRSTKKSKSTGNSAARMR